MIKLKNVSKYYYGKKVVTTGFSKINLELNINEFVVITGESGSGKSTLLNVISGMDAYEDGEMYINGKETSHYTEQDYENYRRKYIGIIFQNFNLINSYTVYQNIELVLMLNGDKKKKEKILKLIDQVGLTKYKNTKVSKLSGGQKQRVAIARALAKDTPIIIADEPTGNLDSKSANEVMKTLKEISKDKLVVIVTHNYEQVEKYATRRIKMHDGKIFEDVKLQEIPKEGQTKQYKYGKISLIDKIKLGIRNTFNIKTKFVLLYLVFLFMISSLLLVYSVNKKTKITNENQGYNVFFNNTSAKRIIIKKKDNSQITNEEIEKIKKIDNVSYIFENDFLLDTQVELSDGENNWLSLLNNSLDTFDLKLVHGRMPETDNEIIIAGSVYEYYIQEYNEVLNKEFYLTNEMTGEVIKDKKYKIVGIAHIDDDKYNWIINAYGTKKLMDELGYIYNQKNAKVNFYFLDKYYESSVFDGMNKIVPNEKVAPGTVVIPEDYIYNCPNNYCINRDFNITMDNLFYKENLNLKVANYHTSKNISYLLGISNYDDNSQNIFINKNDYDKLFANRIYQSSIFVKDIDKINKVNKELEDLGFKTLVMKESYANFKDNAISEVAMTALLIIVIIVLFFVCYFVIKIILKSRNIYYSTLRILGATKWITNQLLTIELFVLMNLSFFTVVIITEIFRRLNSNNAAAFIKYVASFRNYIKFSDYLILYLILLIMSFIISQKFAKSLFKKTALNTIREEV